MIKPTTKNQEPLEPWYRNQVSQMSPESIKEKQLEAIANSRKNKVAVYKFKDKVGGV